VLSGVAGGWVRVCSYGRRVPSTQRVQPAAATMAGAHASCGSPEHTLTHPPARHHNETIGHTDAHSGTNGSLRVSDDAAGGRVGMAPGSASSRVRRPWRQRQALCAGCQRPRDRRSHPDPPAGCHQSPAAARNRTETVPTLDVETARRSELPGRCATAHAMAERLPCLSVYIRTASSADGRRHRRPPRRS